MHSLLEITGGNGRGEGEGDQNGLRMGQQDFCKLHALHALHAHVLGSSFTHVASVSDIRMNNFYMRRARSSAGEWRGAAAPEVWMTGLIRGILHV